MQGGVVSLRIPISRTMIASGQFPDFYLFSLKRNGTETQTATGPLFITAGVNTHCSAAFLAASSNIVFSLLITTAFFVLPSLSTQIFTQTVPSTPMRLANSG